MMRTTNPALRSSMFEQARGISGGDTMTLQGVVNKSFVLLGLLVVTAFWVWNRAFVRVPLSIPAPGAGMTISDSVYPLMMAGLFVGLITAFITIFKREWAPVTAPAYAACEGLFIGGISAVFEARYPGLVMQAVVLTFGTLFCLLAAYKSGLIKATEKFKLGVVAATGAVFVVYLVSWIMSFFGGSLSLLYASSPVGIGFSVVVVVIAALNLVLDFDLIEQGVASGAPRYMEWYGAFALMVTLVWLYIEILRLLAKLRGRR